MERAEGRNVPGGAETLPAQPRGTDHDAEKAGCFQGSAGNHRLGPNSGDRHVHAGTIGQDGCGDDPDDERWKLFQVYPIDGNGEGNRGPGDASGRSKVGQGSPGPEVG